MAHFAADRPNPRWSFSFTPLAPVEAHPVALASPAPMAGEPASKGMVGVAPPLLPSAPSKGAALTMSPWASPLLIPVVPLLVPSRLWSGVVTVPLMSGPVDPLLPATIVFVSVSMMPTALKIPPPVSALLPVRVLFVTVSVLWLAMPPPNSCHVAGRVLFGHGQRASVLDSAAFAACLRWRSGCSW